jgi:hypothetical protein
MSGIRSIAASDWRRRAQSPVLAVIVSVVNMVTVGHPGANLIWLVGWRLWMTSTALLATIATTDSS